MFEIRGCSVDWKEINPGGYQPGRQLKLHVTVEGFDWTWTVAQNYGQYVCKASRGSMLSPTVLGANVAEDPQDAALPFPFHALVQAHPHNILQAELDAYVLRDAVKPLCATVQNNLRELFYHRLTYEATLKVKAAAVDLLRQASPC